MLNELHLVLNYLRQRLFRTALTTLAIVFGVAVIFGFNLMLPGVMTAYETSLHPPGTSDISVNLLTGGAFDPVRIETIRAVEGVAAVSGILRRAITVPAADGSAIAAETVGMDPVAGQDVSRFALRNGRFLQAGDAGKVVIPASLAESTGFGVGESFPILTVNGLQPFTVIGVVEDRGFSLTPQVFISLSDAQSASSLPGKINAVEVRLITGVSRDEVAGRIVRILGEDFQAGAAPAVDTSFATNLFTLFGALALFVGGFLIFNTFRTIVAERRREIGILRALGADRPQIMRMILMESTLQGVIGTGLGLLAGYLFAFVAGTSFSQAYLGAAAVELTVTLASIAPSVLLGIGTTLAAGYLPARTASSITPLAALQPAIPEKGRISIRSGILGLVLAVFGLMLILAGEQTSGLGALAILLGGVLLTPILVAPFARMIAPLVHWFFPDVGSLALSNVTRQPGRTAVTVNTLMVGVAVLVGTNALMGTFRHGIETTTRSLISNDSSHYTILPATGSSAGEEETALAGKFGTNGEFAGKLAAVPGVETVATLRAAMAQSGDQIIPMMGIDPARFPMLRRYVFQSQEAGDPYAALAAGRAIFINGYIRNHLEIPLGGTITLQTSQGPREYHVAAVIDDFTSTVGGPYAVVSQENLALDFDQSEDVQFMIKLAAGAPPDAAKAALGNLLKSYPQFQLVDTAAYRKAIGDVSLGMLSIFEVLLLAVLGPALLGLLNTLAINILERTTEIGLLRAVGTDRGMVRRMILAESLILTILGALIGLAVGAAMSDTFIGTLKAITPDGVAFFPLGTILLSLAAFLALALLVSLIPARNAARLNIVQALQRE